MYNSNGSCGWLDTLDCSLRSSIDIVLGDIRDARFVEQACREIEVVFHLAALIAIPYSYVAPESFVDTNVRGTLNVLEAVRHCRCARLVHASTSEVYGTPDTVPIRETHTLKGQSPYSASKIAADKLCEAYACSFGTPAVVLRPFNTYGPRQSPRAVLASILMQLLGGAKEVRLGSLWPKRDFTFVEDTVRGFMLAGSSDLEPGEVIQLGTGHASSIKELFESACATLGVEARAVPDSIRVRPEQSEVAILLSDASRARERLGWSSAIKLEEGLRRTAEWMKCNRSTHQLEHYYV
jgi:UDP-glucose 4-epimerase